VQTGYITPETERNLLPTIPLRRLGTPNDSADVVVLLARDETRWMTGQMIQVAGGHALTANRADGRPGSRWAAEMARPCQEPRQIVWFADVTVEARPMVGETRHIAGLR
jgi:hypothetical protein